jgi:hypothetical protein
MAALRSRPGDLLEKRFSQLQKKSCICTLGSILNNIRLNIMVYGISSVLLEVETTVVDIAFTDRPTRTHHNRWGVTFLLKILATST